MKHCGALTMRMGCDFGKQIAGYFGVRLSGCFDANIQLAKNALFSIDIPILCLFSRVRKGKLRFLHNIRNQYHVCRAAK
jgi:hypothetical protein